MIPLQNDQTTVALSPVSATAGETLTSLVIDTLGFDYVSIDLLMTTANVVSNKPTTLKLQEGDTTSSYADITAFVGGGTGGFTIPSANTATTTAPYARFNVDTRGRKRYLQLLVSPATTQVSAATCRYSAERAGQTPVASALVTVNG